MQIQILDLENTSGNPIITRIYTEGATLSTSNRISVTLDVGARVSTQEYAVPLIVRGWGPSLSGTPTGERLQKPLITGSINQSPVGNAGWFLGPDHVIIQNNHYNMPSLLEPSFACYPVQGIDQTFILEPSSGAGTFPPQRAAIEFIRTFSGDFGSIQQSASGISNAWISYDVSSGANNQKVFAYSVEILDNLSGLSGTSLTPSLYLPSDMSGYAGVSMVGANCNNFSLTVAASGSCSLNPENDPAEYDICVTGDFTAQTLSDEVASILSGLTSENQTAGDVQAAIDNNINDQSFNLAYTIYQGVIDYNQPFTGDYISFSSYNFDYTGQYSGKYHVAPPFAPITAQWNYGTDYTSIDTLISVINSSLASGTNHLWITDACSDQSLSGYYETGGLLSASKLNSNQISIKSLRLGAAGQYTFTFFAADRPFNVSQNTINYLRPNVITIQGTNTYNNWTTLNSVTGINWDSLAPIVIFGTNSDSNAVTGLTPNQGVLITTPDVGSGSFATQSLYDGVISGYDKCGTYFQKEVHFFKPLSGVPCNSSGDDSSIPNPNNADSGITPFNSSGQDLQYSFLKTGFKFNNTTSYNYYRLVFDQLTSEGRGVTTTLENTLFVSDISFYGVQSGSVVHTGQACLMGASYTGQYMGFASGILSGSLTGQANESGELCYQAFAVSGIPNNNGNIVFNRASGKAVGLFTGVITDCITGTGYYLEQVQGRYYNAAAQCVYFEAPISGFITGSGTLSGGPYGIINDSSFDAIANDYHIVITGNDTGLFTGTIPNFQFPFVNVPCIGFLTGEITGIVTASNSGYYNVSGVIAGSPTSGHSLTVQSTIQATARLNYNTPNTGDIIFINNTLIIYSPGSGNLPPTYFNNINDLTNIINSGSSLFGMTGFNDGTNVYLTALALGVSGNGIPLTSEIESGGPTFNSPVSTGGQNFYYPITPTGIFTGLLNLSIPATGLFTGLASGLLTGQVKQLEFVRDFSGIWDITIGDIDFLQNNWYNYGVYDNSGMSASYSGRPDTIPILVSYTNNPLVYSTDLAILSVSGINMNSGLSLILSGQY